MSSIAQGCSEIGYLQQNVFITYAKDIEGQLVDVHTFNKFFTFQIDRPKESQEGTIKTMFRTDKEASTEGYLFKLRSEYSNAYSDQVQQGMRVSLIDQDGGILTDATTIDDNEGMVLLESVELQAGKTYIIRYDFFEKQLSEGNELNEHQFTGGSTQCHLPYVTQELLIQDKRLVKSRIAKYNNNKEKDSISLDNFQCNFDTFNNTIDSDFGEAGIFCGRKTYTYQIKQQPMNLVKNFEKSFSVRGAKNELITYWYEMVIGYNFMVGSGIKVLLIRTDNDYQFSDSNPFECLYDRSCVLAQMSNKNEIKIDLILTSGEYKLVFFEESNTEVGQFLNNEAGLSIIPITFKLTAYPVLQNEERYNLSLILINYYRVNCPYMFLDQMYIQNKFIEGMQGQRFTYKDKIILNVFNLTQKIDIIPEVDSLLKVQVKESYGVNAAIELSSEMDCITNSMQVGTSELLLSPVNKGQPYTIDLQYSNSIITLSNFFQCPHLNLEITMIPNEEVKQIIQESQCNHQDELDSERDLDRIFNSLIDNPKGYIFQNYTKTFKFNVDQSNNIERNQNYQVTSRRFILNSTMQLFVEIFYEPYLYDLELYLESEEADLVRSHLLKAMPKVEWSKYKGSKSIFVELEPGLYEIKIIQKLPGIFADITMYQPKCVDFQLRIVLQETINNQLLILNSLNYFGFLGPEGKNFGQMVYFCQDCVLTDSQGYYLEFFIAEDKINVNFDAAIESDNDQVQIDLQMIPTQNLSIYSNEAQEKLYGKIKGKKKISQQGSTLQEKEEIISQANLQNSAYRVEIVNQKYQENQRATFTLRIDIQENAHKHDSKVFREILPSSIEEIMRDKIKTEGQKESEFFIGTKFMMGFLNEYALHPFIPKSNKAYQSKYKTKNDKEEELFQLVLPFDVKDEESQVFAAVYEYTGIAGLSVSIYSDQQNNSDEQVQIKKSVPSKYHNYLSPISLTRGSYYLVIEPDNLFPYEEDAIIRFGVDFVLVKENTTDIHQEIILNSMELCGLPSIPNDFNSPQFLHPLSGYQIQYFQDYKIDELLLSTSLDFQILENSLVVFYLSVPKDIIALAEISKTKGTNKVKVSTKELNSKSDNFLKHKDLSHMGVIEFREFLNPGNYQIKIFGYESEEVNFVALQRCQSFRIGLSVSPIKYAQSKTEQPCQGPTSLETKLKFDTVQSGELVYDLSNNIIDTAHIITENNGEGPFLFYFQVAYDSQLEGALSITLNKYNVDSLLFQEVQIFEEQDTTSFIMTIVEEGTYVVAIQSLTSTQKKFGEKGLGTQLQKSNMNTLQSSCLKVQYSYFITSMSKDSVKVIQLSFMDFLSSLFSGNLLNSNKAQDIFDQQIRHDLQNVKYAKCIYDDMPKQLVHADSEFDQSYTLKISQKNFEIIEIVTELDQLLRIHIQSKNSKNNINAFLYDNSKMNNLKAYTDSSSAVKEIFTQLKGQKKAYRLKIVYDSLDENDECPLYDFRISMKPIADLADESLMCKKQQMPADSITIKSNDFQMNEEYAISNDFLSKYNSKDTLTYDINIILLHYKYYFDIELQYDFLTTKMSLALFGRDNNNQLVHIADSEILNEENIGDVNKDEYRQNFIKKEVQRLRVYNEDIELSEGQSFTDKFILRLKFYSKQMISLIDHIKSKSISNRDQQLCFPFDLSIRATDIANENNQRSQNKNEIIRVDFPTKLQTEFFDIRQQLTVFLQFKNSIKEDYKTLKFDPFVYLVQEGQPDDYFNRIYPLTTRMSTIDSSQIVLVFKHEILERGKCYFLKIQEDILGFGHKLNTVPKICTSNCLCNPKGTKSCQEETGICECHKPYKGVYCNDCQEGWVFDKTINECVAQMKCKEFGGSEDCNGHGTCYQDEITRNAKCDCDEGFTHDGNDLCGRCIDPLFTFPECAARTWILEHSNINCKDLSYKMPSVLYQNNTGQSQIYQNDEGLLYWTSTYKLINDKLRQQSIHYFMVKQNSVLRFYFDTMKSGVSVKYTILDDNMKIILSSADEIEYQKSDTVFTLLQQTQKNKGQQNPFTLLLEYQYDQENIDLDYCPMLEIYMLVQPLAKIQNHLQCTDEEIKSSKELKQFSWQLGSQTKYISEHFTLTSDMKKTDYKYLISEENENFIILTYQLKIDNPGNALSLFASYNFESVMISLTLLDTTSNNVIAIEKVGTLQDIENGNEEISMENDMISFIEIPEIDQGLYELQLIIAKAIFLPTNQYKTCLNFDFSLEYIVRSRFISDSQPYEVISVFPSDIKKIDQVRGFKMEVKFNQELDIDRMISNQNELNHICYLENLSNPNKVIYPHKTIIEQKDSLELYFNFKDYKLTEIDNCFKLKCSTQGNIGQELIRPIEMQTNYCFAKDQQAINNLKCNPWAFPKVVDNNCLCTYPYKGSQCEQCENGYIETKDKSQGLHTICVLDLGRCSRDICNNHGRCLKNPNDSDQNDFICQCDDRYDGQFCEKCKDSQYAYPDCAIIQSDIYNTAVDKEYLNRRQYNSNGYQKSVIDKDSIFTKKQQCSWTNFPQDLDRVEFFEMLGGPIHIAEFYTIHHDQDNVIKFTPQSQGIIKIFAQQPEQTEMILNAQLFDIEIGIYDIAKDKFLSSSINHHLDLVRVNGKLEYTMVSYQIPFEYVNHTLYIMFRAVNYQITDEDQVNTCEQVYLEIEFRETQRECKYAKTPQPTNDIIQVSQDREYHMGSTDEILSVYNSKYQFFYYQDFYLADLDDQELDYTFSISIQQKFIERNMIDFAVEILQTDVEYNEIDTTKANFYDKPRCMDICLISGQKGYNSFQNVIVLGSKTYFRLWLFQTEVEGQCANFQLFVDIKPTESKQSFTDIRCEEQNLPHTFNTYRYLGEGQQQQSFHYLEKYRVDNLRNHSSHHIEFELKEPTLIRIVGLIHKHIEFDLELKQVLQNRKSKNLIKSQAKNFEDSIFAQLDTGKYQLKIIFASDEFFLKKPCQFIELDVAMMPLSQVKQLNVAMIKYKESPAYTLQDVLQSENNLLQVFKKGAINTFQLEKLSQENFQSYVSLYQTRITLPSKKNLGIILMIHSDFLFNDVNFALTNVETKQVYHNTRRQILNKLVIDDIPGGEYELIIYAHQCLTNMNSDYLQTMAAKYQIDFNLIDWASTGNFYDYYNISYQLYEDEFQGKVHQSDLTEFTCYSQYELLPENLNQLVIGRLDISSQFMIPVIEKYEHKMEYVCADNEDSLRIIIDRPNTQIKIYQNNLSNEPFGQSYSTLNGETQILLLKNLRPSDKYIIVLEFYMEKNYLEYENEPCQNFKMSILSGNSKDKCLQKSSQSNPSQIEISSTFKTQEVQLYLEIDYLNQKLVISEDDIDIDINIDYSEQLYIPTVQLNKNIIGSHQLDDKDIKRSKIEEIKPKEIDTEIKNLLKYRFHNLKKGTYYIQVLQAKPSNCYTQVKMTISSYSSQSKSAILEKQYFGQMKVYTSTQNIIDQNRYVSSLPISFDTYKYIKEDSLLLFSDYVQIQSDSKQNVFSFTVTQPQTFIRFYLETDDIMITLVDKTRDITLQDWRSGTVKAILDSGLYEIKLSFFTPYSQKKADQTQMKIYYTMMYSNKEIYQDRYKKAQGIALTNCDKNTNFPLALNKKVDKALGENEIVYDYPLIRISPQAMESRFLIDSYSFRINETSRFYMEIGMHMVNHQVIISLSDLRNFGNSFAAKQQFNLNILDIVLSPGDYALIIDQPTMLDSDEPSYCGIFSYSQRITPLRYMNDQRDVTTQNKCQVKEVLPYKIYESEQKTKDGEEYFINSQGTFFRLFENILFRKSQQSQIMPEFDRIQFTPREDGIVSLLFQYKNKGNQVLVKLYDGFTYTLIESPLYHKTAEVSNQMIEEMIAFKLAREHQYVLIIYYQGEISYNQDGREECEYYNVAISINTISYLTKDLTCVQKTSLIKNFVNDLPQKISDSDFRNSNEYKINSFMELRYPEDFDALSEQDDRELLGKVIDISLSDNYKLESYIKYDFPYAVFQIQMFDLIQQNDNTGYRQLEEVSMQLPFSTYEENLYQQTLVRQFTANDLQAKKKYTLAYFDETARFIFDYVKDHSKEKQTLCLYINVDLTITKQRSLQSAMIVPQILSIYPQMPRNSSLMIEKDQKELKISLEFSEIPYLTKKQQNSKLTQITQTEFSQIVTLQIINPSTNQLIYQRKPLRVVKEKGAQVLWSFIFNIQEEQKNHDLNGIIKFNIDIKQLVNEKGKQFELKNSLTLPTFQLQAHQTQNQKKQESESQVSQIQKEKLSEDQYQQLKEKEVKCLCVHGTCPKGSKYCDKCEPGWEGKLCDIKIRSENINSEEGTTKTLRKSKLDKRNRNQVQPEQSNDEDSWYKVSDYFNTLPKENIFYPQEQVKKQNQPGFFTYLGHLVWQIIILIIIVFALYIICAFLFKKGISRNFKDYMPVLNNDNDLNEEDDDSKQQSVSQIINYQPLQQMEMIEINKDKKITKKKEKSPQYTKFDQNQDDDDQDEDESHRMLTNELMLYADSEQDQADMALSCSPELQQQQKNAAQKKQPQQVNEVDTLNEIENVLKEMDQDDDDDSGEHSHFKKYF